MTDVMNEGLRKIERDRDRLIAHYPDGAEARAQWHFDLGVMWGRLASMTGRGHGSACSAYTAAARRWVHLDRPAKAAQARELAQVHARLLAEVHARLADDGAL